MKSEIRAVLRLGPHPVTETRSQNGEHIVALSKLQYLIVRGSGPNLRYVRFAGLGAAFQRQVQHSLAWDGSRQVGQIPTWGP